MQKNKDGTTPKEVSSHPFMYVLVLYKLRRSRLVVANYYSVVAYVVALVVLIGFDENLVNLGAFRRYRYYGYGGVVVVALHKGPVVDARSRATIYIYIYILVTAIAKYCDGITVAFIERADDGLLVSEDVHFNVYDFFIVVVLQQFDN